MSSLVVSPGGRVYNLRKDNPNHPDKVERRIAAPSSIILPAEASLTPWMGLIRDQGAQGSCTGQMKSEIRDLIYRKYYNLENNRTVTPATFMTSAAFAYKTNLIADGDLGQDNGSSIHQSFVTLSQYGICLNSQEPYTNSPADWTGTPTASQYADALVYKPGQYFSLPTLQEVKMSISAGYPVGIGINVYTSFEGEQLANTGFMTMPKAGEQLLGGHAQHLLAFSDLVEFPDGNKGGVFIQNSWSSSWGRSAYGRTDRGCYWMPYAFFTYNDPNGAGLGVSDMWALHPSAQQTSV